LATKYVKGEKCTWIITHIGGEFFIDYKWDMPEKSPHAVYIPRVGVFVEARDDYQTRIFLPARSIQGIRSSLAVGPNGKEVEGAEPDELMKWVEYQCMTNAEQRRVQANRMKGGFDSNDDDE
jgi:hypothetical protein